jgi:hypothetical protein
MQKTKALGSLRSIFPPIHQPLLLNKRESERLLNAIKTSFRAQLAKEHGPDSELFKPAAITTPTITYLPSNTAPAPAHSTTEHVSARPTDRHLHAILNNPLFSKAEAARPIESPDTTRDAHKAVFEKAVGRGLMTLKRAHGFLLLVLSEVKQSTAPTVLGGMKMTGAGLLVLQWLRSSGQERDLSFLVNRAFTSLLIKFMVAEGLEDVVWVWIERLMKQELAPGCENPPGMSSERVLNDIVVAKCTETELEGAYEAVLKGKAMAEENSLGSIGLLLAWRKAAWQTTVESWRHTTPSVQLFEPFVAIGRTTQSPQMMRAHMDLYHPTDPSPNLAVEYLLKESHWERIKHIQKIDKNSHSSPFVQAITSLGIDTIQYLMHADRMKEATRILALLNQNSPWVDGRPRLI